jgi:hypothetical protein
VLVWLVLIVGLVAILGYARESTAAVRVLLVGNSYTFYNELPSMVVSLADSVGVGVSASVIAPGGAWLADHARSPEVATAISDGEYDVVVLQEQSMVTADPQIARDSTYPAAAALAQMAAAAGAEIVFFQTWGHQSGNVQVGHGSFESMQDAITATYADLGIRLAGQVAPVGEAWRNHFRSGSSVPLHDADGSHPNLSGSYLAAAVIAATIIDLDPGELTWRGPMDDGTARLLLDSAAIAMGTTP